MPVRGFPRICCCAGSTPSCSADASDRAGHTDDIDPPQPLVIEQEAIAAHDRFIVGACTGDEALRAIDAAIDRLDASDFRDELAALELMVRAHTGDDVARVVDDCRALAAACTRPKVQLRIALIAGPSLVALGRCDEGVAAHEDGLAIASLEASEIPAGTAVELSGARARLRREGRGGRPARNAPLRRGGPRQPPARRYRCPLSRSGCSTCGRGDLIPPCAAWARRSRSWEDTISFATSRTHARTSPGPGRGSATMSTTRRSTLPGPPASRARCSSRSRRWRTRKRALAFGHLARAEAQHARGGRGRASSGQRMLELFALHCACRVRPSKRLAAVLAERATQCQGDARGLPRAVGDALACRRSPGAGGRRGNGPRSRVAAARVRAPGRRASSSYRAIAARPAQRRCRTEALDVAASMEAVPRLAADDGADRARPHAREREVARLAAAGPDERRDRGRARRLGSHGAHPPAGRVPQARGQPPRPPRRLLLGDEVVS